MPFKGRNRLHSLVVAEDLHLCASFGSNRFSNSTQRATSVFICFRYSVECGSRCGKIELQLNAALIGKRATRFTYRRRCVTSFGDSNGFSRRFLAHNKFKNLAIIPQLTSATATLSCVDKCMCMCVRKYAFSKKKKTTKITIKMESVRHLDAQNWSSIPRLTLVFKPNK